jgi:hypothetical protein
MDKPYSGAVHPMVWIRRMIILSELKLQAESPGVINHEPVDYVKLFYKLLAILDTDKSIVRHNLAFMKNNLQNGIRDNKITSATVADSSMASVDEEEPTFYNLAKKLDVARTGTTSVADSQIYLVTGRVPTPSGVFAVTTPAVLPVVKQKLCNTCKSLNLPLFNTHNTTDLNISGLPICSVCAPAPSGPGASPLHS